MDLWAEAMDDLTKLEAALADREEIDPQAVELLKIRALLSISQEISGVRSDLANAERERRRNQR